MILFDECLPKYLPPFLNQASGRDGAVSIFDAGWARAKDEAWLALAGRNGWHAITADLFGRHRNSVEQAAARRHGVRVVYVPKRVMRKGSWGICTTIIKAWPTMETILSRADAGTRFELTPGGTIKRL